MDVEIKNNWLYKERSRLKYTNVYDCFVMTTENIILKPKGYISWEGCVSGPTHIKLYEELSQIKLNS